MAFPGTYNINYYKGDTYEFNIYPKTANGAAFPLTGYTSKFTISTATGPSGVEKFAKAEIVDGVVTCKIPPSIGNQLAAGTTYYYDVQINKLGINDDSSLVYTLLKGTISVTADVTDAQ